MPEQAREEADHRPGHTRHLDQQAEEHEERHRKENEMAHAFIHAADDDYVRRTAWSAQIADCGKAKCEGDRHAAKTIAPTSHTKKISRLRLPSGLNTGASSASTDNRDDQRNAVATCRRSSTARQPKHGDHQHQSDADRKRSGAPGVDDLKRRGGDVNLVGREFDGRVDDKERNASDAATATTSRKLSRLDQHADDGRHPHVLVALESKHRSQHRKPKKQDAGEFIGPDNRSVEYVAADDSREKYNNFGEDKRSRGNLRRLA